MKSLTFTTRQEEEYELLDSGDGEKLERYGKYVVSRPDPQAIWKKQKPQSDWLGAHFKFVRAGKNGSWQAKPHAPKTWDVSFGGLKFWIKPASFKHVGIFPEQEPNWKWMEEKIVAARAHRKVSVLNLFGYTGGASLIAAKAGAEVCHVDGSKVAVTLAKENAQLSGLDGKPIRFIVDDAREFVARESRRGVKYDAVIMDPPAFGRGPDGQVWKIEKDLGKFLEDCKKILSAQPLFIVVNSYAAGYSPVSIGNCLAEITEDLGGEIECGELTIQESGAGRLLPAGVVARWSAL